MIDFGRRLKKNRSKSKSRPGRSQIAKLQQRNGDGQFVTETGKNRRDAEDTSKKILTDLGSKFTE